MSVNTISPSEAAHFGALAADWWNPKGSSAMLHKLNPVRLRYIRDRIDLHFGSDASDLRPLAGKSALDVGCGAGLLSEPLARMGAAVIGVDASPDNVEVARAHAQGQGLSIDYLACEVADVEGQFDLITAMEVIEHVTDPAVFIGALVSRLAPGGLMILSTPNRTALSRVGLVTIAETFGQIPRGTHDWNKFLTPDELTTLLDAAAMLVNDMSGLSFSPTRGLTLSDDLKLNYLVSAIRA